MVWFKYKLICENGIESVLNSESKTWYLQISMFLNELVLWWMFQKPRIFHDLFLSGDPIQESVKLSTWEPEPNRNISGIIIICETVF